MSQEPQESQNAFDPSFESGQAEDLIIHISVPEQRLRLLRGAEPVAEFEISTAAAGTGNMEGSLKTPTGLFRICEKIGDGAPEGAVFKSRELTGEKGDPSSPEDQVLTRILWLDGIEPGNANTRNRFIYIHGTNRESLIGQPAGNGCVRMRNKDVTRLYDLVRQGGLVYIDGGPDAAQDDGSPA